MEAPLRTTTLRAVLDEAKRRLNVHVSAAIDAEILLAYVLDTARPYLHAWPERNLDALQLAQFNALIERRLRGEPVAYLTGVRGFWSLELRVTKDTLIPRPETELLVELALQRIPPHAAWNIADLGTGSGAIALAIAHERPRCKIVATDHSPAALKIAHANAERLSIHNIEFRLGSDDWFAPLQNEGFDMIVSNPPYVRSDDPHLQDLRFEPELALVAGADGLRHLRAIAERSREHFTPTLALPRQGGGDTDDLPSPSGESEARRAEPWRSRVRGGWLLLEHGYDQGPDMLHMLTQLGYVNVHDYADLAALPRVTVAQWITPHE